MSKGKKANIRPELVGELFLVPGEDTPYRLILCNTEPTAQIQRVDRATPEDLVGISGLSGLVLLKPVRPVPQLRQPRADKGQKHKTSKGAATIQPQTITVTPGKAADKTESDNLIIHVPTGLDGDTDYVVSICGSGARTPVGLRVAVLDALESFGGVIPSQLSEKERKVIQGILDVKKEGK